MLFPNSQVSNLLLLGLSIGFVYTASATWEPQRISNGCHDFEPVKESCGLKARCKIDKPGPDVESNYRNSTLDLNQCIAVYVMRLRSGAIGHSTSKIMRMKKERE